MPGKSGTFPATSQCFLPCYAWLILLNTWFLGVVSTWATGCTGGEECILCKFDRFSVVLDPLTPLKFLQLHHLTPSVFLGSLNSLNLTFFGSCSSCHLTELLQKEKIIAIYLAFSKTLQQNGVINNLQCYYSKAWKLHLLEITGTHFTPPHARKGFIKCLLSWSYATYWDRKSYFLVQMYGRQHKAQEKQKP